MTLCSRKWLHELVFGGEARGIGAGGDAKLGAANTLPSIK